MVGDAIRKGESSGTSSPVAPTAVAAALAATAGAVDAVCFDRVFTVFPANQSGNAVLLGIGLGRGSGSQAWKPALAIVAFAVGVAVALLLGSRVRARRRPELLLAAEIALLVPIAVVVATTDHPRAELDDLAVAGLLLLTCSAMGIQTEVIGRAAGVAVATTYQSGAIVRIAELASARLSGRRSTLVARGVGVLVAVLAAYVGGAALGAALGSWPASLFVPVGVLVVVGAATSVRADAFGAPASPDPPG